MPTLTIELELSEAEYRFASALSVAERRRVASIGAGAAFATVRNVPTEDEGGWFDPTPFTDEEINELSEAVAQQDAGLGTNGDTFFERLYQEKGWTPKP